MVIEQHAVRRRDNRYSLATDAFIDLPLGKGGTVRTKLLGLSASGLAFEKPDGALNLETGAVIHNAVVRVGNCRIPGTLAIRNILAANTDPARLGCYFYPQSPSFEFALMALLAGMEYVGDASVNQRTAGAVR